MRLRRTGLEPSRILRAHMACVVLPFACAALAAWADDAEKPDPVVAEAASETSEDDAAAPSVPDDAASEANPDALDVEAILSNPLGDEAYRQRRSCLQTRAIDRVEILDDTMVLFHVRRRKAWLNQLSTRCLGLEPDMIVNLRTFGGSICRLDSFRGFTRGGGFIPAAHCRLGDFELIEGTQIEALRTALEEDRKAAKLARKARRAERRERRRARRAPP